MILIKVALNPEQIPQQLTVSGHQKKETGAGFEVCNAVSALLYGYLYSIQTLVNKDVVVVNDDKQTFAVTTNEQLELNSKEKFIFNILINSFLISIQAIASNLIKLEVNEMKE